MENTFLISTNLIDKELKVNLYENLVYYVGDLKRNTMKKVNINYTQSISNVREININLDYQPFKYYHYSVFNYGILSLIYGL